MGFFFFFFKEQKQYILNAINLTNTKRWAKNQVIYLWSTNKDGYRKHFDVYTSFVCLSLTQSDSALSAL